MSSRCLVSCLETSFVKTLVLFSRQRSCLKTNTKTGFNGKVVLTYLLFLNWCMFTSGVSVQLIGVKLAAARMSANSGKTAVGVDKSASVWA